jgi:hypothetical protein
VEKTIKIVGLMTVGRCGLTHPLLRITSAFAKVGIAIKSMGGVFYGASMQTMLEECIRDGVDIAVVADWDSFFTAEQIRQIVENAINDDSIDALAALQSRRGAANPLLSIDTGCAPVGTALEIKFEGKPLQVRTAHFGLTVIKLNKLKEVEKPWFWGQPSESTKSWDDGRMDDDIWFWRQWEKAGNSVFVDSSVSIGHMEEMISCFDENGNHQLVYPSQWKG